MCIRDRHGTGQSSDATQNYTYDSISTPDGPIGLQGLFSPNSDGQFKRRYEKEITDGISYTFGFGELSHFNSERSDSEDRLAGWAFGAEFDASSQSVTKMYTAKTISFGINTRGGPNLNDIPMASNHPAGANFAFIDGAVRFISDEISVDILKNFTSINEVEKPERLD